MTSQTDVDKNKETQRIVKHISKSTTPAKKGKREAKRAATEAAQIAPLKIASQSSQFCKSSSDLPSEGGARNDLYDADEALDEPKSASHSLNLSPAVVTKPSVEQADVPVEAVERVEVREVDGKRVDVALQSVAKIASREKRESLLDVIARVERSCS